MRAYMLSAMKTSTPAPMTLWDAYRLANRRRAALSVNLLDGEGLGNGRAERSLRVCPWRGDDKMVEVTQGLTADKVFVTEAVARRIRVGRERWRDGGWHLY